MDALTTREGPGVSWHTRKLVGQDIYMLGVKVVISAAFCKSILPTQSPHLPQAFLALSLSLRTDSVLIEHGCCSICCQEVGTEGPAWMKCPAGGAVGPSGQVLPGVSVLTAAGLLKSWAPVSHG